MNDLFEDLHYWQLRTRAAEVQLGKIERLHYPLPLLKQDQGVPLCAECSLRDNVKWPCNTVLIIIGKDE